MRAEKELCEAAELERAPMSELHQRGTTQALLG